MKPGRHRGGQIGEQRESLGLRHDVPQVSRFIVAHIERAQHSESDHHAILNRRVTIGPARP